MFAEWVTTGVSWGVMIASAASTLLAIVGLVVGFMSILAWWLKGGKENAQEDKEFWNDDRKGSR